MSRAVFETDWLSTDPVYYNEATGAVSDNVNDVIDFANLEFDPEGFNGFLDHGFSAFGLTPVAHVKYLLPSSRLIVMDDGRLTVESTDDDNRLADRVEDRKSESDVLEMLRALLQRWESAVEGDIIIPTSGGYDSRLLNLMIGDKSRVRSFTFGVTERQWDSIEVTRARLLSERLGTRWEQVPIGHFHRYLDEWDRIFGVCMHTHGMYQLEFWLQVLARVGSARPVLSGWDIDRFSGKDPEADREVRRPSDVEILILGAYGVNRLSRADSSWSRLPQRHDAREAYFEEKRDVLASRPMRSIEATRFLGAWLHYLKRLPTYLGLPTYCPGHDIEFATAMLALPLDRRRERRWVKEFFARQGLSLAEAGGNRRYWMNYHALRRVPLRALDEALLSEVVRPEYVRWANRNVSWRGLWSEGLEYMQAVHGLRRATQVVRNRGLARRRIQAYYAYLTLWPIESLLRRRNEARAGRPPTDGLAPSQQAPQSA